MINFLDLNYNTAEPIETNMKEVIRHEYVSNGVVDGWIYRVKGTLINVGENDEMWDDIYLELEHDEFIKTSFNVKLSETKLGDELVLKDDAARWLARQEIHYKTKLYELSVELLNRVERYYNSTF